MRSEVSDAIESLKRADLSDYPYKEVSNQIKNVGVIGYMVVTLHEGKSIFRARLNGTNEHFFSKCQLTYKPQQYNKTCQRASTPNRTMFYGSFLPDELLDGELDIPRIVTTYEAVPWLRDKTTKGMRAITYSRWILSKDVNLIAILQHKNFYYKSSFTKKLMNEYNNDINGSRNNKEETLAFTTFLANEFAKEVTSKDYEYLISAVFTESIVDHGFDGVLYPSVRLDGAGFNVAITPQAADTKLNLAVVMECSVYKLFDKTVLDNNLQSVLYQNQTHFDFSPVEIEHSAGLKNCLKALDLETLDDLEK